MGKNSTRSDGATRTEKKFAKKMQFYELVRNSVSEKKISKEKQKRKRSQQRKLKAFDMTTLSEHLPDLRLPKEPRKILFKINSKTRNQLVLKESNQLEKVFKDPVFQTDPLGSIYQHLLGTQPPADEKVKRRKNAKTKSSKTKRKKPQSQQAMEI